MEKTAVDTQPLALRYPTVRAAMLGVIRAKRGYPHIGRVMEEALDRLLVAEGMISEGEIMERHKEEE